MARLQVSFNEVVIIESLRATDFKTGTELQDYITKSALLAVPVTLYRPATRYELAVLLRSVAERAEQTGWRPLLHFEVHGAPSGIMVSSGELVRWAELGPALRRINIATRNQLVIVLATCDGSWASVEIALHPFVPAPFFGIIAPDDVVNSGLLRFGFQAFYRALGRTNDFVVAFEALKQRSLPEYRIRDAPQLFRLGWARYKKMHLYFPGFRRRVRKIMTRISRSEVQIRGGWRPARRAVVATLRNPDEHIRLHWDRFVMADRFPENGIRFPFALSSAPDKLS